MDAPQAMTCLAGHNRTVPCEGDFMPGEGLCLRHAVLFDFWIAAAGGCRVYEFNAPEDRVPSPTIGSANAPALRRWKRAQFHAWLDRLTAADVDAIMNE